MIKLYKKDARGSIREWRIYDTKSDEIVMEHGLLNGELVTSSEIVDCGKAGRTKEEQIKSRISSRVNRQLDKGYVHSVSEASSCIATNALGFERPMLATSISRVGCLNYDNIVLQMKYNGHRCLITRRNGRIIPYSRNGKVIETIPEIVSDIDIGEGMTVDGELYAHGLSLQKTTSLVKRRQQETKLLMFICYDIIMDASFPERLKVLKSLKLSGRVELAASFHGLTPNQTPEKLLNATDNGYEGLILRQDGQPYESGKRSKSLVKVKSFFDDEFAVADINESADGWAILTCITAHGLKFNVSAPGSIRDKAFVLHNKNTFIGRKVNVKYSELTDSGKPFHPVAVCWRSKESE